MQPSLAMVEVDADLKWFRDKWGRVVHVDRSRVVRRLLGLLVRRFFDAPGAPVTTEELVSAGWPGESVPRTAGQSRVYVRLSRLRAFGLEGVIVNRAGGYMIDPNVVVQVRSSP